FCPKCSSPTKVAHKILEGEAGGERNKVRICRKCGELV
ncbi:MAG: 50S ribosomal protein L24, partial [Candidatus Zixiibacteriota bacterium]